MEHVAELVVMEADLAVGGRLGDGGVCPMVKGGLAVNNGVRGGWFLEFVDLVVVGVAVVDFTAEPFSLEVGVFQGVGIDAVKTSTAASDGQRIADGGADEHLEVADVDAAEVRPPDNLALVF